MSDPEQEDSTDAAYHESSEMADEPKICANCGARIDTAEWHPVTMRTEGPDDFRVYAFCDEDCRGEWANDDSAGATGEL